MQNWQKGTEIRTMEEGDEKSELLQFHCQHKLGSKYIHQYTVEEIWARGDPEPRQVLKRLKSIRTILIWFSQRKSSRQSMSGIITMATLVKRGHGNSAKPSFGMSLKIMSSIIAWPATKKLLGSIKPIFSKNFRDRFQVDLIDFCRLRKKDPFGVLTSWVIILKDCAIRLIYICALPRKQAHLVAYKLQEIFGLIGYPKIFHTDNGTSI